MKNQDTLINQFQKAAQEAPLQKAPAHDAIWDNIENRLNQKELTSKKQHWKHIALAACFLLVGSLLFQWWSHKTALKTNLDPVVTKKTNPKAVEITPRATDTVVYKTKPTEAKTILKKQMEATPVAIRTTPSPSVDPQEVTVSTDKKKSGIPFKGRHFDAVGVTYVADENNTHQEADQTNIEKAAALLVLDDKAVTGNSKNYKSKTEAQLNNAEDIESVTYLPNPLYIINGIEYSEKELFGPNPTSPYYPLNEQDITDTKILQGDQATTAYGEKGAKGVVIITTQNGKPKTLKKSKKK